MCCEQTLKDGKVLSEYSVQSGSTIQALKKTVSEDQVHITDPLDNVSMQQVVHLTYRNIVEKMLQDPEALGNIITASSGLDNDPVAMELVFWVRDFKMTKF